jgi:hypothetical protein
MFEWNWDSVAAECTTFLGPAGYGYVQGEHLMPTDVPARPVLIIYPSVSPAQEHIQGPQWWTDYQPVSYQLTSKRGTRAQYANMISTCHAAGVGVIAGSLFFLALCDPLISSQILYGTTWPPKILG